MSQPSEQPTRAMRPTEYLGPILAILLVLLGAWWYYDHLKRRSAGRQMGPERQEMRLKLPLNGPQ